MAPKNQNDSSKEHSALSRASLSAPLVGAEFLVCVCVFIFFIFFTTPTSPLLRDGRRALIDIVIDGHQKNQILTSVGLRWAYQTFEPLRENGKVQKFST
jgi:hypothetical protein